MQRQPGGRRPGRLAAPSENPDPALGALAAFRSYISLKLRAPSSPRLGRRAPDLPRARFCLERETSRFDCDRRARGSRPHAPRPARIRAPEPIAPLGSDLRRAASIRCAAPRFGQTPGGSPFSFFFPPPFPHAGVFDCQCQSLCLRSGRLACELKKARYYSRNQLKTMRN